MQKKQIDQYDMLLSQENHFDDNEALWISNAPIAVTKTLISSKIALIAKEVAIQLSNPTGITATKSNVRTDLEERGFQISAALCAFGATEEKKDLFNRSKFVRSEFYKFREAELLGVISNLHRDATTELANLASYGVTEQALDELLTSNHAFGLIMKNPQAAIAKRKAATDKIAVMLPEIITLLETRMDNLMVGLRATQPQFVEIYTNLRALRSTQVTHLSLTVTTVEAETNKPIAKVNLEIVGEKISRVSSERGYNTIQNLTAGSHQIVAMHPNYVSKTTNFTIVSGETTELLLILERA